MDFDERLAAERDKRAAARRAFIDGNLDALTRFAWWRDKEQYVGPCGTTLRDAADALHRRLNIPQATGEPPP